MWTRVLTLGLVLCALNLNAQRLINVDFGAHTNPAFTTKTGKAATGLSDLDFWNLYSRDGANGESLSSSQLLDLKLSNGTSTDADLYVSGAPGAWFVPNPDPMFQSYLYPGSPNIEITFSNVPPATYDIYVYSHGEPAAENSVIQVSSGGISYGQKSTSAAANWDQPGWIEDNEYVVFRKVEVGAAPVFVLILPGAANMAVINGIQLIEKIPSAEITISQQPTSVYAPIGGAAQFSIAASSELPLTCQWFFKGSALTNETNTVLHITNSSLANSGSYYVSISNSGNSVQSTNAFLLVYSEVTKPLLNIDFGAHLNPFLFQKTGPAAIGTSLTDQWNLYSRDAEDGTWLDNNSLTNLVWSDGASSGARIDVSNAAGAWYTYHPDAMFHSYLYPISRAGNISAVLSDIPSGTYDVYVYAHGEPPHENAVVQITTPSTDYGIKVTSSDADWNDTPWSEGDHYLVFTNVHIRSGETLNVSSMPGQSGLAVINGLQLLQKSTNPPAAISFVTQPQDQIVPTGGTAEFSVTVTNDPPLAYQWFFNSNPILTATNPVLRIENVSTANVGAYHVQVSTGTDSAVSERARLQIFTPVAGPLLNIDYGAHLNPYLPTNVGPAAVGIALDDRWNLYSRDGTNGVWLADNSLANLVWSDGTPSTISINVTNASGAWYTWNPNPMFKSYLYPGSRSGNIGSVISNLPAGTFDVYVYAHGEIPGENGVIEVSTPGGSYGVKMTSAAADWDTPAWTEGNHFVLFKNVVLNDSEPLRILAKPGVTGLAVINGVQIVKTTAIPGSEIIVQAQPQDAVLPAGTTAELSISASSGLALEYQWYFNGTQVSGATSAVLRIENLQHAAAGEYYVVVRNSESAVTSRTAALQVYTSVDVPLLNIDFGAHQNPVFTTNVGPAAFGRNLDDRWNLYSRDDGNFGWRSDGVLAELVWTDGTNSNVHLEVSNAAGAWYTFHPDPMFESYLYPLSRVGDIIAKISNLPAGTYDLVVYAHGQIPSENGVISIETQSTDYGTKTNSPAANWDPGYWVDGGQFVVFTNVNITVGETLEITSQPGESGLSVINGLQLILREGTRPDQPTAVAPFIIEQPQSLSAPVGGIALFSVSAGGSAPLHYQWQFNGSNIAGANQSVLILSNLTVARAGEYSVQITNSVGFTNSAPAVLTVAAPQFDRTIAVGEADAVQEGARVSFPILVSSSGGIGALSFVLNYDTNYLAEPDLAWNNQQSGAFTQVNTGAVGAIHATYVLPGRTFRAGQDEELATVTFRARSVPESLTTPVTLVLNGVYSDAGDPITSGTAVESGEVQITRREYIGDNNANDRLDVGDATAIIRMLTLLDPVRAWDVTGNDLNVNSSLDAGDIVRVLRAVVNIDPQPGETNGRLAALALQPLTPAASLTADRTRLAAGQQVRVQVAYALPNVPLSGAAFRLDFPTNALRLESSAAHVAGALVPQNALAIWNLSPGQDYAAQDGTIHFAASTATPWPASSGTIAELTFTVLDAAASKYAWPIRLVSAEAGSGIDVIPLDSAELILTGRDAQSAEFNTAAINVTAGGFELRLTGEPDVHYQIESSTNLVDWQEVGVYSSATGAILISDPIENAGHKFYRAIQID